MAQVKDDLMHGKTLHVAAELQHCVRAGTTDIHFSITKRLLVTTICTETDTEY